MCVECGEVVQLCLTINAKEVTFYPLTKKGKWASTKGEEKEKKRTSSANHNSTVLTT